MGRNAQVYDLGSVEEALGPPTGLKAAGARRRRRSRVREGRFGTFLTAVVRSLSLFVPGTTQLARGRFTLGLFFVASLTFLVTLTWALLGTLDRLAPTLDLLGRSTTSVGWTLGIVYVLAAAVHLSAVWNAMEPGPPDRHHPAVVGVASGLVPGWGQLLNGDRMRAVLFVGGLWLAAGAWIVSSPAVTELLNAYAPVVTPLEQTARTPFFVWTATWTAPFAIWALSVYDATASAVSRRKP